MLYLVCFCSLVRWMQRLHFLVEIFRHVFSVAVIAVWYVGLVYNRRVFVKIDIPLAHSRQPLIDSSGQSILLAEIFWLAVKIVHFERIFFEVIQ